MKIEDIQKAADEFADREYEYNYIDRNSLSKGFYHGSKWRINSVWNDVKEIPKKSFAILAIRKDGSVEKIFFTNTLRWKNLIKRCGFVKWAYMKDLIPDKEE